MRILFLIHSLRRGGAERVLLETAMGLRAKGHEVEVVSWLDVDEYREKPYCAVPRHFLMRKDDYRWPWALPKAAARLQPIVEKFRPDVMEIHTPTVAWVAAWANLKIPCIHALHSYGDITRKGSVKDWVVRRIDRLLERRLKAYFIAVSKSMINAGASHFNTEQSRFICVPNGVDLRVFKPRQEPVTGTPIILMIGTLSPNKGQTWGIRALSIMKESIPDVKLKIVGEGADRLALENLIKELKLENYVELMGRREEVSELLQSAHIFWHLSESEGLPMVVLEAMATGLPVVGFDVRGTRDVVVNGETGFLVPLGDFQAVAQKTIDILNDAATYKRLSLRARQHVENKFSLESMVDGHERILSKTIESNKAHE